MNFFLGIVALTLAGFGAVWVMYAVVRGFFEALNWIDVNEESKGSEGNL